KPAGLRLRGARRRDRRERRRPLGRPRTGANPSCPDRFSAGCRGHPRGRSRRGGDGPPKGTGPQTRAARGPADLTRDERERLEDIAEAIETIRTHAVDTSAGERIKRDAILYNLVILGEAVKDLGEEIRALEPEIPWRQIAGLRD